MKPIDADKNALDATKALLDFSNVPATRRGLKEALGQHPDFPSLSSLSDVLNDFQVPNISTRLTPDRLAEIPLPALTYLNIEGGMFAPLRSVNGSIEWLHTQRGWQKDSISEFVHKWSGVTLLVEPNEQSGERQYAQNRRRETLAALRVVFIVGAIIASLGLLLSSALRTFPWNQHSAYYLTGLTKLVGTIVSGTLVWYSLDTQNSFLQRVCQLNGKSGCQSILNTSAAKITDWLGWAEVGLFYFAGGLITWGAGLLTGDVTQLDSLSGSLYLLTVLALPYTIWSVYYQAKVAREWCVLCLTVQLLLWVELLLAITHYGFSNNLIVWMSNIDAWKTLLIAFVITPAIWAWIKPHLYKAAHYQPLYKEFQKLKFDPIYLEGLFNKQRVLPPIFDGMKVIEFGNSKAKNKLIVVANPTCAACQRNHKDLEKMLKNFDDLHVMSILAATPNDESIASKVAQQILNLPEDQMVFALNRWYEYGEGRYNQWSLETNKRYDGIESIKQLKLHNSWLELAGVTSAPAYFLNGVELPKYYLAHELQRLCAFVPTYGIDQFK